MVPRLTDANFYDVLSGPTPSLVTFSMPTRCRDCAMQKPALEEMVLDGLPVYLLDAEQPDSALAEEVYGRRGIPFHRIVQDGEIVRSHLGRSDAVTLRDLLSGRFQGNGGDHTVKRPTPELWALMHRHPTGSKDLINEVRRELPCQPCIEHFDAYVKDNPPPYGPGWFAWTVTFHNAVSARIGKKVYSMAEAIREWR